VVGRRGRSATAVVVVIVVPGLTGKRGGREQTTAADHGPGADAARSAVVPSVGGHQGPVGRRS